MKKSALFFALTFLVGSYSSAYEFKTSQVCLVQKTHNRMADDRVRVICDGQVLYLPPPIPRGVPYSTSTKPSEPLSEREVKGGAKFSNAADEDAYVTGILRDMQASGLELKGTNVLKGDIVEYLLNRSCAAK